MQMNGIIIFNASKSAMCEFSVNFGIFSIILILMGVFLCW